MKIENVLSAKGIAFLMLFSGIALVASSINFSSVLGAPNQSFTLFQFMGPIAGGFLGAGAGVLSVLLAQVISFIWLGKSPELLNILRLAPMLFAALYFAKYSQGATHSNMQGSASFGKPVAPYAKAKLVWAAVPLACMALFMLHPIGAQAWFYSLYWLIPALALMLPENLFMRSLGSTFTAHAIGGITWLYLIPSTPEFWVALIPIVAFERLLFAMGISVSYVAFNTLLSRFEAIAKSGMVAIDRRYVLSPRRA